MINIENIIAALLTDFYKTGHVNMIPKNTTRIYSNITARSSRLMKALPDYDQKALLIGIYRAIDDVVEMWNVGFFRQDKTSILNRMRRRLSLSLPSNVNVEDVIVHFAELHDLGYLPLRIKALPEGRRVPMKVPFMTIVNTHDTFAFLTNYVETVLSCEIWKTIVNATEAFEYRRYLNKQAILTTGTAMGVPFQGHDFSYRGMSGNFDAMNTGIAHLSCFVGTDTIPAIEVVEHHYQVEEGELVGCSVPATEHMVMCLGGEKNEIDTFRYLIKEAFPTGIVSIVSDTWDFFKVVTEYVTILKDDILVRTPDSSGMAKTVFRPDSGDPVKIICGDPDAKEGSPEYKGAVECLWDVFGGTTTAEGYKVLNERVGVIYGDSITLERMVAIVEGLKAKGFASTNIIFGIGSYTYQFVTRDSLSVTVKATEAVVGGEFRDLLKNPKTDNGTKKSASGLLRIEEINGEYVLFEHQTEEEEKGGCLIVAFEDGQTFNRPKWKTIKTNVEKELELLGS